MMPGKLGPRMLLILAAVCAFSVILMSPAPVRAGWFDDTRLTDASGRSYTSDNNARCVVSDTAGNTHVLWVDERNGEKEVYYKMFDGSSWSSDTCLCSGPSSCASPSLAADSLGNVHMVYNEYNLNPAATNAIYYKKHDGAGWGPSQGLSDEIQFANPLRPALTSDASGRLYVVWDDRRTNHREIYYKHFDGVSWSADTRLTTSGKAQEACVAVDTSGRVHVVWDDTRNGWEEVYYKMYDGTWSTDQRLTDVPGRAEFPCIASDGLGNVHLVYQVKDSTEDIYHVRYMKHDGTSWGASMQLDGDVHNVQIRPSIIAGKSGTVDVVWATFPVSRSDLYYRSNDGTSWGPELRLTYADGGSQNPTINQGPEESIDAVWTDDRDGNDEIYWKRFSTGDILPKPAVVSVEPDSAQIYSTVSITDLAGTSFVGPAEVWLYKPGEVDIDAINVDVVSSTQITCDFVIGGVASGFWDVTLRNADNQMDTLASGFCIVPLPAPEVTSIDPDSGYWHTTVEVTDLAGSNFHDSTLVWLQRAGEPNINATNINVLSPSQIACDIYLDTVQDGFWDVVVELPDGQRDTLVSGFRVLPVISPEITSIEPATGLRDSKVHITDLAGSNFAIGAAVWLQKAGEINIEADSVTVESASRITCYIELAAAAIGYWDVVVENPDSQRDTLESGFFVDYGMWSEEIRLTTADEVSSPSKPNARCIAVDSEDNLHVVWEDNRVGGTYDIYYKKYDGAWSADQPIVANTSYARNPAIAVGSDDVVHVVWEDDRDGHYEVYYKYYNGSWSSDERLTNTTYGSGYPSVAAFGDSVHVVWQGRETMYPDVYYRCHDGTAWGPDHKVSFGYGHNDILPSVAAAQDGIVHVVWCRLDEGDLYHRFYNGVDWNNPKIIGHDNLDGTASATLDSDNNLHVAWHGLDGEIYYRWRSKFGAWQPEQRLTYDVGASHNTSVVVDADGNVHIPFVDDRTGNREIYCISYDGTSWQPEVRLTNDPADSRRPSAAIDSQGRVHLIYRDSRFGNQEILYRMRFTSPTSGIGPDVPEDVSTVGLRFMPNPAEATGEIRFSLPRPADVSVAMYDVAGRLVWSRDLGTLGPGIHHVPWDGDDQVGKPVAQGVYFLSLQAGENLASSKIVVIR